MSQKMEKLTEEEKKRLETIRRTQEEVTLPGGIDVGKLAADSVRKRKKVVK